jgi:hypothetical protein
MPWDAVMAIASVASTVAFILTALYVRGQLRAAEKDRYLAITNQIFEIWQDKDFMAAQLWLLHQLKETTWADFVEKHRGDYGEAAFHRVGAFYTRLGALTRLHLVDEKETLSTLGGYALAVWQKIEPLVKEARALENSTLFADFERIIPACYECYVPNLDRPGKVKLFASPKPSERIERDELQRKLESGQPVIVLDVRKPADREADPRALPGARYIAPDAVADRWADLPHEREIAVYCA